MKTWNYNDTIKQRGNYSVCAQRNSKPTVSEQTRQKKSADCGLIHKHKRLWFNKQDNYYYMIFKGVDGCFSTTCR